MTHLSHALLALRDRRETTISALAARAQVAQGSLSRLMSEGRRPDVETLRALCTLQADPRDGLELLLAHLRDEVDRSGRHQTEVRIEADNHVPSDDIRLLEEQSRTDKELRAILHDFAELVRAIRRKYPERQADSDLTAAED